MVGGIEQSSPPPPSHLPPSVCTSPPLVVHQSGSFLQIISKKFPQTNNHWTILDVVKWTVNVENKLCFQTKTDHIGQRPWIGKLFDHEVNRIHVPLPVKRRKIIINMPSPMFPNYWEIWKRHQLAIYSVYVSDDSRRCWRGHDGGVFKNKLVKVARLL